MERNPTIEQKSQFTAKTKQGQDVEFETTVKFYISPKGEVRINVPGGQQGTQSQGSSGINTQPSTGTGGGGGGGGRVDLEAGTGSRSMQGQFQGTLTDDTIDSAFPRGPDCPCPKQFVPDPCKAMDDFVRNIKDAFTKPAESGATGNG